MAAQSIFDLGNCTVRVQASNNGANYDLGAMGKGDTQTFEDDARAGEVVTVAIDETGVVTLSRDTPWNDPGGFTDGYRIDINPVDDVADGAQVWIEDFGFANTNVDPQPQIQAFVTENGDDSWEGEATEDGAFSPDPTPAVTLSDANKPVQYSVTATVQGGA
jgi:hypothetical protein